MFDTDEELPTPFDAEVLLSEYGPDNLEAFGRDFMESLLEDLGRILKENGLPAQGIDSTEVRFAAAWLLTEPLHIASDSMEEVPAWVSEGIARIARLDETTSLPGHDADASRLDAWNAVLGDPGDDPDEFRLNWLRILQRLQPRRIPSDIEVELVVGASYLFTVFRDMAHAVVPALASGRINSSIH